MTSNNHDHHRDLQRDARAWAHFTGMTYTAAEREMKDPRAQGFLGERVSARHLIAVLTEHPVLISAGDGKPILGDAGLDSQMPFHLGKETFIELALVTDVLRMFTPTKKPKVGSYELKHTVERFLGTYVTNGKLIWAAAALGLQMTRPPSGGLNVDVGVSKRQYDYVWAAVTDGADKPKAHHNRPAGYEHLRTALQQCTAGQPVDRWVQPAPVHEDNPFHDWMIAQARRDDDVGQLAGDYSYGVRYNYHQIAHTPDDLLVILGDSCARWASEAALIAIAEWSRTPMAASAVTPPGIRTVLRDAIVEDAEGYGAGPGNTEWYEYRCPCGADASSKNTTTSLASANTTYGLNARDAARNGASSTDTPCGTGAWNP